MSGRITFQGYECKFMENPLPCNMAKCKHGDYCRSCDACGMTVEGPVYHCENDNKDFHVKCTELQSEICVGDVVFRLQEYGPSKCLWCNKKLLKGTSKNIRGLSYVSNHNDYTFHVNCVLDMVQKHGGTNSSLSLPQQSNVSNNKWLHVFQIFFKTVLAILIGDPTTILASTLAHLITSSL